MWPGSVADRWRALALAEIELQRYRHLEALDLVGGEAATDAAGGNGEEIGRHILLPARALRGMFARILAECAVSPARIRGVLAGIEPAYALTLAWSRDAERATAAEAAAIANYGR